jgi:hypothetical protein
MQAWLATVALKGHEIRDPDAAEIMSQRSMEFLTLVDLSVPPPLLVIRLGVKSARNQAMPEVLLESIRMRSHEGKPTWLWDQPSGEGQLGEGHLSWSPSVMEEIDGWTHIKEGDEDRLPVVEGGATGGRKKRKAEPAAQGEGSVRDLWLKGNGK